MELAGLQTIQYSVSSIECYEAEALRLLDTKPGTYGEDTLDYSRARIRKSIDIHDRIPGA